MAAFLRSTLSASVLVCLCSVVSCSGGTVQSTRESPKDGASDVHAGMDVGANDGEAGAVDAATERPTEDGAREVGGADVDARAADQASADARVFDASGADSGDAARTVLCVRLNDPRNPDYVNGLGSQVTLEYLHLVSDDCRVGKIILPDPDLFMFANAVLLYSLDLWGCQGRSVSTFGLVPDNIVDLTAADASALIDKYIQAAMLVLELNAREAAQMRQDLTRVSASALTRDGGDYALSVCSSLDAGDASAVADTGSELDAATEAE